MASVIIRKMSATFGKLKNANMELGPGLNVICAPNEYGKSTWCAFIKAMLYGIDTSERDKNGFLSAKTKFRPWDGGAMAGTMEITSGGRDITMQRTNHGTSPMKNLLAVYSGTADFIKELNGENVGEALTGVSSQVFERTAFIRRPELRINQTSDLEKRISSLISSGEETSSYSDSDELLRAWQRKLKYNRSGSIPALEQQLRDAEDELRAVEKSAEELAGLRGNIARLQKQVENLENDLVIHDKLDKRAAARRIVEMRAKVKVCEERVQKLTDAVTKNGHKMTREDISDIRTTASSIVPLRKVLSEAEKNLWQAEKDVKDIAVKKDASPFAGCTEDEAMDIARRGAELEGAARKAASRRIPKYVPIAVTVLGVIALLVFSGFLSPFSQWFPAAEPYLRSSLIGLIAALVILAAGVCLFFVKPGGKKDQEALDQMLSKYGVASSEKLSQLSGAYVSLCRGEIAANSAKDSARASYDSALAASTEANEKAVAQLSTFMPEVKSGDDVMARLDETEALLEQLTRSEFDMVSARSVYETLLDNFGDEESAEDDEYLPVPLRDRDDTVSALERAKLQLQDSTRAFDLATGAQRSLGDPAVIQGRIQSLKERIADETHRYNALGIAIDTLSSVNAELQTRFSPLIGKKAGEILSRLTDGRYEKLAFSKGFDAEARISGDPVGRNVLSLSDGTADEVYLSLRLAMCELMLNGDDPCPIILDDALISFDDGRCAEALDLLLSMAEQRQIILFTCHTREAAILKDRDDVNIVTA